MKNPFADYIGFYEWEERPCRIRPTADGEGLTGEIYHAGKGFCPMDVADIAHKASPLSEREFRERIVRLTGRKG